MGTSAPQPRHPHDQSHDTRYPPAEKAHPRQRVDEVPGTKRAFSKMTYPMETSIIPLLNRVDCGVDWLRFVRVRVLKSVRSCGKAAES